MLMQRQEIVDRLEENGDIGTARQIESVLPEQVDTERASSSSPTRRQH